MRRVAAIVLALLLAPVPVAAQSPAFQAYVEHAVESMGVLGEASGPDALMAWADDQLAWNIANPPEPCYAEAFTRGVAVAETVRAVAWMSTDQGAAIVGSAYVTSVMEPAFEAWVAAAKAARC